MSIRYLDVANGNDKSSREEDKKEKPFDAKL